MGKLYSMWSGLERTIDDYVKGNGKARRLYIDRFNAHDDFIIRGSKCVIGVKDLETAEGLKERIDKFVNQERFLLNSPEGNKRPFELNVKIIDNVQGDVVLKRNTAKSTMKYYTDELIEFFNNGYERYKKKDLDDVAEGYRKAVQDISVYYIGTGEKQLYLTKVCGESYRIGYFDSKENKSKYVAVGDVLILIGAENCYEDRRQRKRRSDNADSDTENVITSVGRYLVKPIRNNKGQKGVASAT